MFMMYTQHTWILMRGKKQNKIITRRPQFNSQITAVPISFLQRLAISMSLGHFGQTRGATKRQLLRGFSSQVPQSYLWLCCLNQLQLMNFLKIRKYCGMFCRTVTESFRPIQSRRPLISFKPMKWQGAPGPNELKLTYKAYLCQICSQLSGEFRVEKGSSPCKIHRWVQTEPKASPNILLNYWLWV